jgi:DNA-binding transcriptional regulator GbsR (MarR family)
MKEGQKKIFNSLTLNPEGLSFSELHEKTDLSNTALSNYLKGMNESGLIIKDYKHRKYHLPTTYMPMELFGNEWQKFMKGSVAQFVNLGLKISNIKNIVERKEALQSYLQGSFHLLTLFLWQIVGESTRKFQDIKDLKDQELMLEKSRIINEEIQNWVIGITDSLATSMLLNADLLDEAGEPVYQEILHHAKQNMKKLENILNLKEAEG